MYLFHRPSLRWVAWFLGGLLSAVLFFALTSIWQSAKAISNSYGVKNPALVQIDEQLTQDYSLNSTFAEFVATHQEPNFY
jgi:hypothetical protein